MSTAFFPASMSLDHASTRIRAMCVHDWLTAVGIPIDWNAQGAETAVVFKRPAGIERLKLAGKRVIYDISDDYTWSADHRRGYEMADTIVAGTEALAERVRTYNPNVVVIPDCIDPVSTVVSKWRKPWNSDNRRHVLWFGCWGSKHHAGGGMMDILSIKDALNSFNDISLTICSNSPGHFEIVREGLFIPAHYEPWNRQTFGSLLRQHDVVIIPVTETPYTRAKSHNRVTTAIAAGVPVIASDMPSYREFGVTTGSSPVAGYKDWGKALAGPWRPTHVQTLRTYYIERIGEMWKTLLLTGALPGV